MHIDRWDRSRKEIFLEFLKYVEANATEFFVLGDIFDFPALKGESIWPRHSDIILPIRSLAGKGIKVTYMIGNHDISLRGIELSEENFTVTYCDSKRPMLRQFFGQSLYIEHGHYYDPLFQDNVYAAIDFLKYLTGQAVDVKMVDFLRDMVRIFQRKPKNKLAELTQKPDEPEVGVPERFLKIWDQAAEQLLKKTRCNFVIFGHTHAPGIMRLQTKGQFYVNTGDWVVHSTYVEMDRDGLRLNDWIENRKLDVIEYGKD